MDTIAHPVQLSFDSPKLCECGCGQPTKIATWTNKALKEVRGQPLRFIVGHNSRLRNPRYEGSLPLCECGCGERVPIARSSDRKQGRIKGQPARFISGHHGQRHTIESFWANVDKTSSAHGCWLWIGPANHDYGRLFFHSKHWLAHRLSYYLTHGTLPNDVELCHNCPGGDNKLCVNPAHLFPAPHKTNMEDASKKGQMCHGTKHRLAKLTEQDIPKIRAALAAGKSRKVVGRQFGVSESTIRQIAYGLSWAHVK